MLFCVVDLLYHEEINKYSLAWHCTQCWKKICVVEPPEINSTYSADASVLVWVNTESAQITCMHCYKFQTPAATMYL